MNIQTSYGFGLWIVAFLIAGMWWVYLLIFLWLPLSLHLGFSCKHSLSPLRSFPQVASFHVPPTWSLWSLTLLYCPFKEFGTTPNDVFVSSSIFCLFLIKESRDFLFTANPHCLDWSTSQVPSKYFLRE